ncbi:hypothetical protein A3F36_01985 [Candidatus Peribacteria bacterium RIFCSPHIGHO2_12_FULL_55_11]|nr:MAG: hypothetical protein A3F36_01985 [Candidatus Peribacteria bacterium RIFCSPHIGHO2_12_FULL_55_11]
MLLHKILASASVATAFFVMSTGVADAAAARGYIYNNGNNAGAGHVVNGNRGYSIGRTNCAQGHGCIHHGQGAGVNGGAYNNNSHVVRNANGTCSVYSQTNFVAPGTSHLQTRTTSKIVAC